MEDFKLILYVLAAVAYFIFMQWRKAFNAPDEEADVEPRKQERRAPFPTKPATSFEDILRELQPKLDKAEAQGKAVTERAKEQARSLETPPPTYIEKRPVVKNYEDLVRSPRALSWENPADARLAKRLSEGRQISGNFINYDKKAAVQNKYASLLRNPASVRDAVVLKEILTRKYD